MGLVAAACSADGALPTQGLARRAAVSHAARRIARVGARSAAGAGSAHRRRRLWPGSGPARAACRLSRRETRRNRVEPAAGSGLCLALRLRPGASCRSLGRRLVGLPDGLPVSAPGEHGARGAKGGARTDPRCLAGQPGIRSAVMRAARRGALRRWAPRVRLSRAVAGAAEQPSPGRPKTVARHGPRRGPCGAMGGGREATGGEHEGPTKDR